ncbi:snRNA-activating protein complex subunit 4 isoform X2 [Mixophyes fleayi]|uniref:snRNA-activating protein complex subunit 4 isoform X2 n=1 Tax=Mixophyes fleayi TaxID=3061075 RepID=UPI003F4D8016
MSASHINAERDKIQREIEALERTLGPNVSTAEPDGSVASEDSDDDDFDIEDRLDGDGQTGPPANEEMVERTTHIVKTFKELTIRKLRSSDNSELRNAIISDTLQRTLQPKLLKLEYLQQKRDDTKSDIDRKIFTKQIQETEREIDDINQLPENTLLGQREDEHDWEKISNINFEGAHSAERLRKVWQNYEHPHINKEPWEDDETCKLQEIAKKHMFVNWQEIAQELGTKRTAFQCLQRFQLNNKDFKRKEFTKEEDEILAHFVQRMRVGNHIPYRKIAYFMEGRDSLQLLIRWSKSLDPSLTKGPWNKTEDEMLLKAVAKHGEKDWYKIRFEVPGRSDVQCRERYYKGLHKDVKKGKWSQEEREKLVELTAKYGVGHWTKVSRELTHRTGSQCLSKWKHITGYFKRKQQCKRIRKQRPKKIKEDVLSEEESSTSNSSSSSVSVSSSSESEDNAMESTTDSEEDHEQTVAPLYLNPIPDLNLWIPRRTFPDLHSKTLLIHSAFSGSEQVAKTKIQKKGRGDTFQFNTILKGIAYPPSTDTVTETPEDFLLEAVDSGCRLLQIGEDDVRKVLRQNMKRYREKQVQRLKRKHTKCSAESGMDNTGNEELDKSFSRFSMSQMYRGSMDKKLLFAVTPWVGNVFLPLSTNCGTPWKRRTQADVMRMKLRSVTVTSTPMFTLLIQLFQIDAEGCLQMIRLRKFKESEFLKTIKSCSIKMGQKTAKSDLLSPKSILACSFNTQEPKAVSLQVEPGSTPKPQAKRCVSQPSNLTPKVTAPGPTQKPKTVYELLKEKRMQQSRVQKANQNTVVLSPNILVSPQMLIHQQCNPTERPPRMGIPMASPNAQNSVWPVMPFVSLPASQVISTNHFADNQLSSANDDSIIRTGTDVGKHIPDTQITNAPDSFHSKSTSDSQSQAILDSQASVSQQVPVHVFHTAMSPAANSNPISMTWLVTPKGLLQFPAQALTFPSPTQPTINQSTGDVSASLEARAVEMSTNEACFGKISEAAPDVRKSPNQTLPAMKSSLSQEGTAKTSVDVRLTGPLLPAVTSAPSLLNRSSPSTLMPRKYPVVKIAKLLPTDHVKIGTVNLSKSGQPGPILSSTTQTSTANTEKKVLDVSHISFEEETSVKEWLQGKKGVEVAVEKSGMAYLPPSICTLKTFSRILLQKKYLEECAFKLVPHVEDVKKMTSSRKQEILNDLVEQKLKDNQAYQMLKQRFLSAFTFPGFLAIFTPAKSKSAKEKREDSDEDSDDSMYTEMNRHGRTINNTNSTDGQSDTNTSGAAVFTHTQQEETLNDPCQAMSADNTNGIDNAERRITRTTVRCGRLT